MKRITAILVRGLVIVMLAMGWMTSAHPVRAQADVPAGATITSATLSVYLYILGSTGNPVNAHRINHAWVEDGSMDGVTWNSFYSNPDPYDPAVAGSFTPQGLGWYSMDLTALVQSWVNGTPNNGILLEQGQTYANIFHSSEFTNLSLRPKLQVCYTAAGIGETCVTIQRPGSTPDEVADADIWKSHPDTNNGTSDHFYTGLYQGTVGCDKQTLIRFNLNLIQPDVTIVKYTNGQEASNPNGTDVPRVKPGEAVTWLYKVTNTGQVAVARSDVLVTDDMLPAGQQPVFDKVLTGSSDQVFSPGDVWQYIATGTAIDLGNPSGVKVTPNVCTNGGTEPPRNGYVNNATATIPGATDAAKSSYCNPPPTPDVQIIKYTNGQVASDPNGADVPEIKPGETVTWTYKVTNIGQQAIPQAQVEVTDNMGAVPVFEKELSGNGDTVFDPGEEWLYQAKGVAIDLQQPGPVTVVADACKHAEAKQPARNAYVNQGTVKIPGASDTAQSSYCNPLYRYYLPSMRHDVLKSWQTEVGFEDLPLVDSPNDYDYNDWITGINGMIDFVQENHLSKLTFQFLPHARGADYHHIFHVLIPANTFPGDGTATLTTYDKNHNVISKQSFAFVGSTNMDFVIFPNTANVFPGSLVNTIEGDTSEQAQMTADLEIQFNQPFIFDFTKYNFRAPHGTGLFFDPYLEVMETGNIIHRGDIRMLIIPSTTYKWPEETVRIDKAYPVLTYIPGNPANFLFPDGWWTIYNHCVYDGVPCGTP
ncbi:MAG: DNRLRE domain-containing protein [Omnitrophica WOR_2 bacterium]